MSCIDFDQSSWIALHTFIMSLNAKLSVVARMVSFETLWHHKILEFWRFFLSSQISRPYLISSHSTLQPTVTDPVPVVASLSGEIWAILLFFLTQRSTLELNVCSVSRWTFPLLPVRLLSACVFPTPGVGLVSSVPPQKKKKKSDKNQSSTMLQTKQDVLISWMCAFLVKNFVLLVLYDANCVLTLQHTAS